MYATKPSDISPETTSQPAVVSPVTSNTIPVPDISGFGDAQYYRSGNDLIIQHFARQQVVEDYFVLNQPPSLQGIDGVLISPAQVLAALSPQMPGWEVADNRAQPAAQTMIKIGRATIVIEGPAEAVNINGISRTIQQNDNIYINDTIITGPRTYIKITLLDGTVFQLGPLSRATLENYDYEENAQSGSFDASIFSGIFRFISGGIAENNQGTHTRLKTPSAVIGIRGSEIDGEVMGDGSTVILHTSGLIDIVSRYSQQQFSVFESGTRIDIPLLPQEGAGISSASSDFISDFRNSLAPLNAQELHNIPGMVEGLEGRLDSPAARHEAGEHKAGEHTRPQQKQGEKADDTQGASEHGHEAESVKARPHFETKIEQGEERGKENNGSSASAYPPAPAFMSPTMPGEAGKPPPEQAPSSFTEAPESRNVNDLAPPPGSADLAPEKPPEMAEPPELVEDLESAELPPVDSGFPQPPPDVPIIPPEVPPEVPPEPPVFTLPEDLPIDTLFLQEDEALHIPVTNDIIGLDTPPQQGHVQMLDTQTLLYTPVMDYFGFDQFSYRVPGDVEAGEEMAETVVTVPLFVMPVNDAPQAEMLSFTMQEDTLLSIPVAGILAQATDVDSGAEQLRLGDITDLRSESDADLTRGLLRLSDDGKDILYTPHQDYHGSAWFQYQVEDTQGARSEFASIRVDITPVNDTPQLLKPVIEIPVQAGETFTLGAGDLLMHVQDVEQDPLQLTAVQSGEMLLDNQGLFFDEHGNQLSLLSGEDGQITTLQVQTDIDFNGQITLSYEVTEQLDNDAGASVNGLLNLQVFTETDTNINSAPQALDDQFRLSQRSISINPEDLLSNDTDIDGDSLQIIHVSDAINGSLDVIRDPANQHITRIDFTPQTDNADISTGGFRYTLSDGQGGVDQANVQILFAATPANQPPQAIDDVLTVADADSVLSLPATQLLANDHDPENQPLTLLSVNQAINGSVLLDNGILSFTPDAAFAQNLGGGFRYLIADEQGAQSSAQVTLRMDNQAPIATDDSAIISARSPSIITASSLLDNDHDPDGDPLSLVSAGNADNGSIAIDDQGNLVFTPDTDFKEEGGSFDYSIFDDAGGSASASVTLTPQALTGQFLVLPNASTPLAYDNTSGAISVDAQATISNMDFVPAGETRYLRVDSADLDTGERIFIRPMAGLSVDNNNIAYNGSTIAQLGLLPTGVLLSFDGAVGAQALQTLFRAVNFDSPVNAADSKSIEFNLYESFAEASNRTDAIDSSGRMIEVSVSPLVENDVLVESFNVPLLIPQDSLLANDPGVGLTMNAVNSSDPGVNVSLSGSSVALFVDAEQVNTDTIHFQYQVADAQGRTANADVEVEADNIQIGGNANDILTATHSANVLVGNAGNDQLTGSTGNDILQGGADNDVLNGGGGLDRLQAGSGDDVLQLASVTSGGLLDGGTGNDTLLLLAQNQSLDFIANRALPVAQQLQVTGIENINLTGSTSSADNQLILEASDVLNMADNATLAVTGDASSSVFSTGQGWNNTGPVNIAGVDYTQYSVSGANLLVSTDITNIFIF
ncbi:Ig-like domain-containing protein [Candidatus Venteria ishoeyi]|nr:cadherin-like domain-containing protein [Candidatus Venteria ishoeyi]